MQEAVQNGFNGYFSEVDARDTTKIRMSDRFLLSSSFFHEYFEYLKKETPSLIKIIKSPTELKKVFTSFGTYSMDRDETIKNHKEYTKFKLTFLEMNQMMFTDALSAIKLMLIGKLMADGYIEKGPIIDYEGSFHLDSKIFFLQYPQYAMEIVLRTINELMAGAIKTKKIGKIYEIFNNPD
jgi:hypothetical protein